MPTSSNTLEIHALNIGYGDKCVLRDLNLTFPGSGILGLMGPSGSGKSTLFRTIGRWNDNLPSFWVQGDVRLDNESVLHDMSAATVHQRLAMLPQKARFYTGDVLENLIAVLPTPFPPKAQQRWAELLLKPLGLWPMFGSKLHEPVTSLSMAQQKLLLLARLTASQPDYLLLDEPLRDISVAEESLVTEMIRHLAELYPIVLITHNKREARQLCDQICLISGERIIETTKAERFFNAPQTTLGQEFLECGSSWPRDQKIEATSPIKPQLVTPREFHWILPNKLGGMQWPGLLGDAHRDLNALQQLGVTTLVNLTEQTFDTHLLDEFGIRGVHFPITDMQVPTLSDAQCLCNHLTQWLAANECVVLHCKAGLGRTGLMLACYLVSQGNSAVQAIDTVRLVNSHYIQSKQQFKFIGDLAAAQGQCHAIA